MIEEQLRRAVAQHQDSLRTIATRADMDHGQLSRFVRHERTLQLDTAERLAQAVGCQLTLIRTPLDG